MEYGHSAQRRFESWDRKHFHAVSENGSHYIVGNGAIVMRVVKPSRKNPKGRAEFIGLDGKNEFGAPFVYSDYFLLHELAA